VTLTDFTGANLSDVLMDRAVLNEANFSNALLERAVLTRSDLGGAVVEVRAYAHMETHAHITLGDTCTHACTHGQKLIPLSCPPLSF
jgi:uncharacterized protein YjbI with pentapeptide repeats